MLTNKLNLPQPFVDAATSNHKYTPKRYSVTEVLGGTCEAVLKRRHHGEADEDVADRVFAIFGSAVHEILCKAEATKDQMQENWLSVPLDDGYELSGIFDLYDDSTGTVTDWKVTSVWKLQVGDFEDWRKQTLIYCWMLRQVGFDARRGEVVAILRDHSMRKAKFESGYPPHPVHRIEWDFTENDFREAEEHVTGWFGEIKLQEQAEDEWLHYCTTDQRWHKPDKWAVMEKGKKRALKLHDSEESAQEHVDRLLNETNGKKLYVEFRPGEDTKCQSYCPVAQFCPHGKTLQES